MYEFCMWYALVIMTLGLLAILVSDGSKAVKYTPAYKLAIIALQFPTFYFLIGSIMGR